MEGAGWVEVGILPGGRRLNAFEVAGDGGARERVRRVSRVWLQRALGVCVAGVDPSARSESPVARSGGRGTLWRMQRRGCGARAGEAGGGVGGEGVRGFGPARAGMPAAFSRCLDFNVPNGRIQGVSPLGCTA